jgi:hypothetical protein
MSLAGAADYFSSARLQLVPATCCTNTYTTDLFGISRQVDTTPVASPATSTPQLLPRQLSTTSACADDHDHLGYTQAKCQFQLNILTAIILVSAAFADLLYMLFLVPFSLPLRHARGLGVADLDTLGGLGFVTLRVVRPEEPK